MTTGTELRVDRLSLRNFRCFAECAVDLHPQLTMLVAENGQGKTAILDGLRVALQSFVDGVTTSRPSRGFERADVRLIRDAADRMSPVLPTAFTAEGYVAGQFTSWSRSLGSYGVRGRSSTKDVQAIGEKAEVVRRRVNNASPSDTTSGLLPLVASYGTGRLWSADSSSGRKVPIASSDSRLAGYAGCLSSSSSFNGLITWYHGKMDELRDARFSTENSRNIGLIAAVNEAVRAVLSPTGWTTLDWDVEQRRLVVTHSAHGRLPLSALSDGVRHTTAIVADIARRCAELNPQLRERAARDTPGVLLIDEVDMHLHPRWQQLIIELFREAFPLVQIIATTHSPHVLSTVDKTSIRVIRVADGQASIDTPRFQTKGVQSADALASIMGVDPVPQIAEAVQMTRYRALIEDGMASEAEAQALRASLVAHFGEDHPLMLDCDRLIRFQAFRLRRERKEGTE